ncbi:tyrosine-type recombinase/integrase [Arachidicoccus terrestris]|uniref:tyrosine-type recombinase/integrase n=1 Tax=Arachidicoccus terrestris TaxID=2875539 RepID=UPI001CC38E22|nr:site-specific integrase [Arachidicoccus terrestris]UAY56280.1 site-specific integrase [Arachidicoccus terrestris]
MEAKTVCYTPPKIVTKNPKDCYVYFRFFHAGKWHVKKYRGDANRDHMKAFKMQELQAVQKAKLIWLQNGWNPILDPDFKNRHVIRADSGRPMTFAQALKFSLSKKKVASKTMQDYGNQLKFIEQSISRCGYDILNIKDVRRIHIRTILDDLDRAKGLSNHGFNKYRDTLRALLGELLDWDIIEFNPAANIRGRAKVESSKYIPLTEAEKKKIAENLERIHFNFFVFSLVVYHAGIRPKEVLALKIGDIDLLSRVITIRPDLAAENSKTKNVRRVPIDDELYNYLMRLGLSKFPHTHYAFGSNCGTSGNRGKGSSLKGVSGAMRPDFLSPSTVRVKRDTVTNLWGKLVIKGLGINKHLYALKHTGGNDKIVAGVDLDALRSLYGHTNKKMTETYVKQIKGVYQDEIIKKSPNFVGAAQ